MTKFATRNVEGFVDVFDGMIEYLDQTFADPRTNDDERAICAMLGRSACRAFQAGAVYIRPNLTLSEIHEHVTIEKREAFAERLKANTQAVFNHGDPGPEKDIIFTFHDHVQPLRLAVLYSDLGHMVQSFVYRQMGGRHNFFPFVVHATKSTAGKSQVFEVPMFGPSHNKETTTQVASIAFTGLTYLDEALEHDRVHGGYTNGISYLMSPIMSNLPEFLHYIKGNVT